MTCEQLENIKDLNTNIFMWIGIISIILCIIIIIPALFLANNFVNSYIKDIIFPLKQISEKIK